MVVIYFTGIGCNSILFNKLTFTQTSHSYLRRRHEIKGYLTNRFHFAVGLYSDNAQMTSKRGENKEVLYEPQASSVTDVLTTF